MRQGKTGDWARDLSNIYSFVHWNEEYRHYEIVYTNSQSMMVSVLHFIHLFVKFHYFEESCVCIYSHVFDEQNVAEIIYSLFLINIF